MSMSPISPKTPRSKLIAALLALSLGTVGAHAWYLRRSHAWAITLYAVVCAGLAALQPVWWDNPAFFLLFIPAIDGFVEAAVFSLLGDEKFDARYNVGRPTNRTGWPHVLTALATVLIGGAASMFMLAMVVVYVYHALGWLDGLSY
ncbi:MAG: hypothetical protein JHC61_12410 [Burkholderiaceae bacterium]|nr:hypothetical protein [Burkholderiaceae bacterium]